MKNVLIAVALMMALVSCGGGSKKSQPAQSSNDVHTSQNSLDYEGTYIGKLPAASGGGMDVKITLTKDGTYEKEVTYEKEPHNVFETYGKFAWNSEGNTITLEGEEKPNQYFVGENTLTHLDVNGKRIEGDLAKDYVLKKQ